MVGHLLRSKHTAGRSSGRNRADDVSAGLTPRPANDGLWEVPRVPCSLDKSSECASTTSKWRSQDVLDGGLLLVVFTPLQRQDLDLINYCIVPLYRGRPRQLVYCLAW